MYWNHTLVQNVFLLAAMCLYIRARRFGQDECTVQELANLHSKHWVVSHFLVSGTVLYSLHHYIWLHTLILCGYTSRHCYCCWHHLRQKYVVLKSQTHGSLKCLGLKYQPNCICYIMSCLNIAQQQCELIYLWKPWRGQHFFHTFEKSLGGRNGHHRTVASYAHGWALCLCVNWFCKCVCVYVCVCVGLCSKTWVRLLAVLWGMVLLGSALRKPNTGMGCGSWELWTSSRWLLTTGALTSVALWGDNTSGLLSEGSKFQHTQDV